jgi:hypothetical protein
MNETNSSTQPNHALSNFSLPMLLAHLAKEWIKATNLVKEKNRIIIATDEKVRLLYHRFKKLEYKLNNDEKDFLCIDLLDSEVSELLISLDNGTYECPPQLVIYDVIQETDFENAMNEVLQRYPLESLNE